MSCIAPRSPIPTLSRLPTLLAVHISRVRT
jgi:hypothetical protein